MEEINTLSYTAVSYASHIWNMTYEQTRGLLDLAIKEHKIFLRMDKEYFMLYVHGIRLGDETTYKSLLEFLLEQHGLSDQKDSLVESGGNYENAVFAVLNHFYPLVLPPLLPPGFVDPLDNRSILYAAVKWNVSEDEARRLLEQTAFEPLRLEDFHKHIQSVKSRFEKTKPRQPLPPPSSSLPYIKDPAPPKSQIPKPKIEPYYIPKQTAWDKIVESARALLGMAVLLLCGVAFVFYNSLSEGSYDVPEPTDSHSNYDPALRYDPEDTTQIQLTQDIQDEISAGCPDGCDSPPPNCDIKGNISAATGEKIYHMPGQDFYTRTEIDPAYGERWFCTEEEARANGWRKAYQ